MKRKLVIMDLGYRIVHLLNMIFFISLALSGLVMFLPGAMSRFMYAVGQALSTLTGLKVDPVMAGIEWARTWHRIVGIVWGLLLITYLIYYLAFNRKFHIFKPIIRGLGTQIREAKALSNLYIKGEPLPGDVARQLKRYNVFVGWLYTVVLIPAVILLSVSGVALLYREQLGLSISQVRLMLALHDTGFVLGVLFLLLHLFASLHPANRPLLRAVFFDGGVPEDWAKGHMSEEVLKEVTTEKIVVED